MGFLLPAGLGFAALLPAIVALYFLKLRRRERQISSTWLWRPVLLDRRANSLWQKLKVSLLLLLQLLAALALILSTARPFTMVRAASAASTVIVLDATGAMQATDVLPNRLAAAKAQARLFIGQMPAGGQMSVILLTRSPQILVANSSDQGALRAALDDVQASSGDGDIGQAIALAYSLLRGHEDGQIVVIGSGRYRGSSDIPPSPVPVTFIPIASEAGAPNLAVSSFATRQVEGDLMALAQVSNYGPSPTGAAAEFWADGTLVAVERQRIEPGESRAFTWVVPQDATELELRLPATDALALDNRAWVLPGGQQRSRVALVSAGNPFLLKALALVQGAQVTTIAPDDFKPGDFDLYIFDQVSPPEGPAPGRMMLINPPGAEAERFVGKISPRQGEPLLKYVDSSEVSINLAGHYQPDADARILWEGQTESGSIPLLWTEGNDRVVMAFALQQSDLPLRVAFPILVQNLMGWLLPPAPVDQPMLQPATSVSLRPWPTATRIEVKPPSGDRLAWDLAPGIHPPILEIGGPGIYQVSQRVGGGTREARFPVNVFSSLVSDLSPIADLNIPVLPEARPVQKETPLDLWRWLGWLALGLIGMEWWVYRRGY